jgi:hypothetical protein
MKYMQNNTRQNLDSQKMKDTGRVLGFFNAYSKLQTGEATYRTEQDASSFCDPKVLGNPKLLKRSHEDLDPHVLYLKEEDCRSLYTEGWEEGYVQGTQAYETQSLELIGDIAHLAGSVASFHSTYTTAESDARDCKVVGEARTHFIANWRKTGGDKRKVKGI